MRQHRLRSPPGISTRTLDNPIFPLKLLPTTLQRPRYTDSIPFCLFQNAQIMKAAVILGVITALAAAQSLNDFPPCSVDCLARNLKSVGCSLDDVKCACNAADAMSTSIWECLHVACGVPDGYEFYLVADRICKFDGTALSLPEPLHKRDSENLEECRDTIDWNGDRIHYGRLDIFPSGNTSKCADRTSFTAGNMF
jgi:hypothetical protein